MRCASPQGLLGIGDLDARRSARDAEDGRGASVSVRRMRRSTSLHVAESLAEEPTFLTCDSNEPRRARRCEVSAHRVVSP